jgi:GT2 family glycosyltransferase
MPTLSLVVPATDAPPTLARCLARVAEADDGPDEVIVVDAPEALSAAAARNAGAARATGDVVVFVDADVEVHPDAFTRIRAAFAADPALDAVYGAYDDSPGTWSTVSAFRNLLHHHVHHQSGGPSETFWTGLGAVRRHRFLAVGGFDAGRYPHPSVEDIDLGHRLAADGARIVLDPAIQGSHLKRWTLRSMLWTDFARRGIPWVALQLRSRRVSSALNLGWRHRLSALACVVAVLALVLMRPVITAAAVGLLVALNRTFYGLLVRRQGAGRATIGVLLHALHHLVAVASVPVGIAAGLIVESRLALGRRGVPAPTLEESLAE